MIYWVAACILDFLIHRKHTLTKTIFLWLGRMGRQRIRLFILISKLLLVFRSIYSDINNISVLSLRDWRHRRSIAGKPIYSSVGLVGETPTKASVLNQPLYSLYTTFNTVLPYASCELTSCKPTLFLPCRPIRLKFPDFAQSPKSHL